MDGWLDGLVVPLDNHTTLWPNLQPGLARTQINLSSKYGPSVAILLFCPYISYFMSDSDRQKKLS